MCPDSRLRWSWERLGRLCGIDSEVKADAATFSVEGTMAKLQAAMSTLQPMAGGAPEAPFAAVQSMGLTSGPHCHYTSVCMCLSLLQPQHRNAKCSKVVTFSMSLMRHLVCHFF